MVRGRTQSLNVQVNGKLHVCRLLALLVVHNKKLPTTSSRLILPLAEPEAPVRVFPCHWHTVAAHTLYYYLPTVTRASTNQLYYQLVVVVLVLNYKSTTT